MNARGHLFTALKSASSLFKGQRSPSSYKFIAKMATSGSAEPGPSCLVTFVTCSNIDEAKKLSRNIVKLKFAACVNIVPQITSVYEWESKIEEDTESMMIIKTMEDKLPDLIAHIQKEHSYDVPEVIAVKVEGGSVPYLKWVENTCNPKKEI